MGTIRLLILAMLFSCNLPGQLPKRKRISEQEPLSTILDRFLGSPPGIDRMGWFTITLRFVSNVEPESQVSIACFTDKNCQVTQHALSRSLGGTIEDIVQKTGKRPKLGRLRELVEVRVSRMDVEAHQGIVWLQGLCQATSEMGSLLSKRASEQEGSGVVEVFLDPSTYEVHYRDAGKHFEISVPGPDPSVAGELGALDPLVRWMFTVQRQVRRLHGPSKP